jgi:flagellar export protein FliJ
MAKFVYRLQKVYELRERKLKEQEQRVLEAQTYVRQVENAIETKRQDIVQAQRDMRQASPMLFTYYDNFIYRLNQELDQLKVELVHANERLEAEKKLLVKAQADLEALEKHKEMAKEQWLEEEKQRELKMLDEIAGQRYFRSMVAKIEEAIEDGEDPDDL